MDLNVIAGYMSQGHVAPCSCPLKGKGGNVYGISILDRYI